MRHKHVFKLIASKEQQGAFISAPMTALLYKCKCGEYRTELLTGSWTHADLSRDPDQGLMKAPV